MTELRGYLLNLSDDADARLDELASRWGVSRSVVAETAIRTIKVSELSERNAVAVEVARRARR